jgi:hypothetical protein
VSRELQSDFNESKFVAFILYVNLAVISCIVAALTALGSADAGSGLGVLVRTEVQAFGIVLALGLTTLFVFGSKAMNLVNSRAGSEASATHVVKSHVHDASNRGRPAGSSIGGTAGGGRVESGAPSHEFEGGALTLASGEPGAAPLNRPENSRPLKAVAVRYSQPGVTVRVQPASASEGRTAAVSVHDIAE